MNKREVDQILQPLKERPDLSPGSEFKSELRNKLEEELAGTNRRRMNHWVPNLMAAALLLAGIYFGSELITSSGSNGNEHPAVSDTNEEDSQIVMEITEEEARELIGTAFAHYSVIVNGGGPDSGSLFQFNGKEYRFMGEDFETEESVLTFLKEKYTKRIAAEIFEKQLFIEQDGKLAQPNKNISGNLLWADGEIQRIREDSDKIRVAHYKVPVETDGEEQFQIFELTLKFQDSWKVDEILPFSHGDNTEGDIDTAAGDPTPEFTLTPAEKALYEQFKQDLNEEHLRDWDPISVAKLYINAELENNQDVVYALYTDREGYVQWTKEQHMEETGLVTADKAAILQVYNGIQEGEFIQSDENSGWIKFHNPNGMMGFQMVRDEDGIWNVGFMPIQ
jgi:hypothetical protein